MVFDGKEPQKIANSTHHSFSLRFSVDVAGSRDGWGHAHFDADSPVVTRPHFSYRAFSFRNLGWLWIPRTDFLKRTLREVASYTANQNVIIWKNSTFFNYKGVFNGRNDPSKLGNTGKGLEVSELHWGLQTSLPFSSHQRGLTDQSKKPSETSSLFQAISYIVGVQRKM